MWALTPTLRELLEAPHTKRARKPTFTRSKSSPLRNLVDDPPPPEHVPVAMVVRPKTSRDVASHGAAVVHIDGMCFMMHLGLDQGI
ncbi:hypothetical protein SDRG_02178 [Saprolegnia diclina VS20]|uniref:Uncharacterized protein n=1 Tax=Saprolegnia diclina (strain VS20) TaxID=1156394 RepID=T0QQ60_SAPDV|nr:hypothetical protein SDRG_02178 [Saprolegnia diclina VS20]EQC40274.1 hypothetical protein SDRG_02178 [Saprolegnia diclina VS20]|eukprot:XP_008605973.1 hypothetical protein SDRG_02178 [Saprolegnia diclina VS20]